MITSKTYRFRLDPNKAELQLFAQFAGCCRYAYNWALASRKAIYEKTGKMPSGFDQSKELTIVKKTEGTKWLEDAAAQPLQQALGDLDVAYQDAFRRLKLGEDAGFPKFKKKGQKDSFKYPQRIKVKNNRVFLPKIGWVKFFDSQPVLGVIKQATVKRERDRWFITVDCEIVIPDIVMPSITKEKSVGIDVGIKIFATFSDGNKIENPRFLGQALAKLKKAQQVQSKKIKFSNNWYKEVRKVGKIHTKIKNSRKDFLDKVSTNIVKNHDVICVEDLGIKGMVKKSPNSNIARSLSDVGWGTFLNMLEYKAKWYGRYFIKVDRYFPSTKTCSGCGNIREISIDERAYSCDNCNIVIDRDYNAALNIRSAGLAVLGHGAKMLVEELSISGFDESRIPNTTVAACRDVKRECQGQVVYNKDGRSFMVMDMVLDWPYVQEKLNLTILESGPQ